jgi:hypothetical protein
MPVERSMLAMRPSRRYSTLEFGIVILVCADRKLEHIDDVASRWSARYQDAAAARRQIGVGGFGGSVARVR